MNEQQDGAGWYVVRQYEPNSNAESYRESVEWFDEYPPRNEVMETYRGPFPSRSVAEQQQAV
ncbi:MAG TPA: hypothetical protein VFZ66_29810 [Herpetosiphonaceae bacterium]